MLKSENISQFTMCILIIAVHLELTGDFKYR